MKSTYYVATVVNAYRRAIDNVLNNKKPDFDYIEELKKTSNRTFTTGFYFNADDKTNLETSRLMQTHDFIASVIDDSKDGKVLVELRTKFKVGDTLEVLSPTDSFNKQFKVEEIVNLKGVNLEEAKKVKEQLFINTKIPLKKGDILRRKIEN